MGLFSGSAVLNIAFPHLFQRRLPRELCHSSCPKSVASSRTPGLWNLHDPLGISLLWARGFQAGFWAWAVEFLEDTKECVCLFWFCVCLFQCCFPSPFLSQLTPEWFYSLHGDFCRGFWCPSGFLLLVGLSERSLEFSAGIPSSPQLDRECLNLGQKICVNFVLWLVSNEMLIVLVLFGLIQRRNGSTELFSTVCLTSFGLFDSDMVGKTCKSLPEVQTLVWILCVHLGYSCLK